MSEARPALTFVVESGTDVRLVEGLARDWELEVLARRIAGGREISQPPAAPMRVRVGPASRWRFALWAAARCRRESRTLVQGYGLAALSLLIVAPAKRLRVSSLVCSPVEVYYRCRQEVAGGGYSRLVTWALRRVARAVAHLCPHWIVLSDHLGSVIESHGARGRIDRIPVYGVDPETFFPCGSTPAEMRRRLGLAPSPPHLLFSSRVAPEKDVATLLAALAELRRRGVPVVLLHRSGGWRDFVALAESAGVADLVDAGPAVDPRRDLRDLYCASDLVLQASRAEGLGFSVLEAMACGRPVVATAVGGLLETVSAETGWPVVPGDSLALADTIADALAGPEESARRAAAGRRMVHDVYDRDKAFADLRRALETVD